MVEQAASDERKSELIAAYEDINEQVKAAAASSTRQPRLVAVSKLKPPSDILALYEHGVRHFGENYPQELSEKARELPTDINWHFIGALQSNKAKMLASIPNLFAIETLTSIKAANGLSNTIASLDPPRKSRLNVYLQLNTSSEESKAGLSPSDATDSSDKSELVNLATHVMTQCHESLRLRGLMTIGSIEASKEAGEADRNPDFEVLAKAATDLVATLRHRALESHEHALKSVDERTLLANGLDQIEQDGGLELSMGMSDDFVAAIKQGSANVRVGSKIFGARPPRKSASGAA